MSGAPPCAAADIALDLEALLALARARDAVMAAAIALSEQLGISLDSDPYLLLLRAAEAAMSDVFESEGSTLLKAAITKRLEAEGNAVRALGPVRVEH